MVFATKNPLTPDRQKLGKPSWIKRNLAGLLWELYFLPQAPQDQDLNPDTAPNLYELSQKTHRPVERLLTDLRWALKLGLLTRSNGEFYSFFQLVRKIKRGELDRALLDSNIEEESSKSLLGFQSKQQANPKKKLKRVLILASQGGGGHISAAQSIIKALGSEYEVKVIYPIDGVTKVNWYDSLFSKEKWFRLNLLILAKKLADLIFSNHPVVRQTVMREEFDLLISVFPVANNLYRHIARKRNLPFLIIPTDFDISGFLRYLGNEKDPSSFTVGVPLMDSWNQQVLANRQISAYRKWGYPIQGEFQAVANLIQDRDPSFLASVQEFRQEMGMKKGDKLLFISFGAKGYAKQATLAYIDAIKEESQRNPSRVLHVMVACGKNQELFKELEQMNQGLPLSIRLHPQTWLNANQMSIRMAALDIALIKPGGSTTAEYLTMQRPAMIRSDSARVLPWEKYNLKVMAQQGLGTPLASVPQGGDIDRDDFVHKLRQALDYPASRQGLAGQSTPPDFGKEFRTYLHELELFRSEFYGE